MVKRLTNEEKTRIVAVASVRIGEGYGAEASVSRSLKHVRPDCFDGDGILVSRVTFDGLVKAAVESAEYSRKMEARRAQRGE